jgi:hypothetical protein
MAGGLAAAIDELVSVEPPSLSDATLRVEIIEVRRQLDRLEHHYATLVTVADRRTLAWADGSPSTAAWVQARTGQARRDVYRVLNAGRLLEDLPILDAAWAAGEISTSLAVEIAAGRRDAHGDVYAAIEALLVDFAANQQWRELGRCIDQYHTNCDALDDRQPAELNGLFLDRVARRWAVNGDLDDLTGTAFDTALKAAMGKPVPGDERTVAQRRADALHEIVRYWLDHAELPLEHGRSPHLTIGFDLSFAMAGLPCPQLRIWDGPQLSLEQLATLICEANLARLIVTAPSVPLDMGRDVRDANRAQRRAAARRDGGCRFPGCDRSAWRCQPHHVTWWDHNGQTNISNLVLLYHFHHRVVHRTGWRAVFDGITFTVWNNHGELIGQTLNQGLPPPARAA